MLAKMVSDSAFQFDNITSKARSILILLSAQCDADALSAAYALDIFLRGRGAETTIALAGADEVMARLSFLPRANRIINSISSAREFVLLFNTRLNNVTNVRTERGDGELRIFITPEKGLIDPRDFSFIPAKFSYDLAIVLGSPDKESLGVLYEQSPDLFYEVPLVNIDNHAANEYFGQLNIVDLTASSLCEIVAGLMAKVDETSIDEGAAQCLLTGIVSATHSFQQRSTTPKALETAAMLMARGASHQEIVRHLFKTQPLKVLKLWGRIMARLVWEEDARIVWAPVLIEDLVQSRATATDISLILEKVRENYASAEVYMAVFSETPETAVAFILCAHEADAQLLAGDLQAKVNGGMLELRRTGADATAIGVDLAEKIREALERKKKK
ncbi:MAG TPA: hypothetical protein PKA31_03365 [Candidatus Moranbacteria bacterium]|nr:hypothetical protein [Candidatus Moranbacteria bacterium]